MSGVANCKDLWMSGHRQVWSDNDLSRPVCFYLQPAPGRRRNNSRAPQNSAGPNSLSANDNSVSIYTCDTSIGMNLNA